MGRQGLWAMCPFWLEIVLSFKRKLYKWPFQIINIFEKSWKLPLLKMSFTTTAKNQKILGQYKCYEWLWKCPSGLEWREFSLYYQYLTDFNNTWFNFRQQALFHVLAAYSMYNTEVGYCQGMSEIAALLLMYLNEEVCYCMLFRFWSGN